MLVEHFAESGPPGTSRIFRIPGGNDRLATGMAKRLRGSLLLESAVRRVTRRKGGVRVTIEGRAGHTSIKFQGYMNGAIEGGLRAAAEIAALKGSSA